MNTYEHRPLIGRSRRIFLGFLCVFIGVHLWLISSCSSKPTNLRSLAPADTLVYLETNDLAAALQPIVDNKAFTDVAKSKPDFSALRGVQLAVVVTGFETKEEKLTEENSVGRVQPHFAAIADTHAWSWQARSFAENQLGEFVNNVYGGGITLDTAPKNGGTYYTWTSEDGRKAYAFVDGSLIFFGNDEGSIDRCLAVKRGQADSILKNPKLPAADPAALAQGYISTDGVAQIANIVGLAMASKTDEEEEVKSFIAGVLPQILRSSVSDVSWTGTKTDQGIEDKYLISTPADVSNVLSETLVAPERTMFSEREARNVIADVPGKVASATRYNLKDPRIAWRSVLLLAQKLAGPASGTILSQFASLLFEPYGIKDPETFLDSIGHPNSSRDIVTVKLDLEGERLLVIATQGDEYNKTLKTLTDDMKPPKQNIEDGRNIWTGSKGDLQAVFVGGAVGIGSAQDLQQSERMMKYLTNDINSSEMEQLAASKSPVTTVGTDPELPPRIASTLSDKKSDDARATSRYLSETRFTKNGIERKTVSDFGLIGSIIAQLAPED